MIENIVFIGYWGSRNTLSLSEYETASCFCDDKEVRVRGKPSHQLFYFHVVHQLLCFTVFKMQSGWFCIVFELSTRLEHQSHLYVCVV